MIAEKGNQAGVRKTREKERRERKRERNIQRERERERIERKTKKGWDERAKSGDEVSVVKSTVAAPTKNSN